MYIRVDITPEAKANSLRRITSEKYEITVRNKAEHNFANKKMLELLADELKVPVTRLRIISGHHHPHKLIALRDLTPEEEEREKKRAEEIKKLNDPPPGLPRHRNFGFKI